MGEYYGIGLEMVYIILVRKLLIRFQLYFFYLNVEEREKQFLIQKNFLVNCLDNGRGVWFIGRELVNFTF